MPRKVYIVSTGIITSIGADTATCLNSLLRCSSGISAAEILETRWAGEIPVGEIKHTNRELAQLSNTSPAWPRTALLSALAVQEAWEPFSDRPSPFRIAFISANTVGGMDLTEAFYPEYLKNTAAG